MAFVTETAHTNAGKGKLAMAFLKLDSTEFDVGMKINSRRNIAEMYQKYPLFNIHTRTCSTENYN
jgi:hypothetical protein